MLIRIFVGYIFLVGCGAELSVSKKGGSPEDPPSPTIYVPTTPNPTTGTPTSPPLPKTTSTSGSSQKSDPDFSPYIQQINELFSKALAANYQVKTPIKMVPKFDNKTVLARCISYSQIDYDPRNYIEVSKERLDEVDPSLVHNWLLLILVHEIGHCDFTLPHSFVGAVVENFKKESQQGTNGKIGYKWPMIRKSIMWPSIGIKDIDEMVYFLDDYAKEIANQNYHIPGTFKEFQYQPNSLPAMGYQHYYRVFSRSNDLLLETLNGQDYASKLFDRISLIEFQDSIEEDQPTFNCDR